MSFIKKLLKRLGLPAGIAIAFIAVLSAMSPMSAMADAQFDDPAGATAASGAPQAQEDSDPDANLPFLFAVFIITWAAFFGYVFYMSRRQREMRGEIEALQRVLERRESSREGEGHRGSGESG